MSDPSTRYEDGKASGRRTGLRAPEVDKAVTLCLEAASAFAGAVPCADALDALEKLLPTLSPGEVDALIDHPAYVAVRPQLLRACGQTWFDRECELARRALDDPSSLTPRRLFEDHIPRGAYADELAVLRSLRPRNILIIGNGACPMSAIVIQEAFPSATVAGMDRSTQACELSTRLLGACGYEEITVLEGDATSPVDIEGFDCMILALTVGIDETEKRQIIRALARAADPGAHLVIRTAAGWGRVLYPGTDLPEISARANRHQSLSPLQRSVAVAVRMSELSDSLTRAPGV